MLPDSSRSEAAVHPRVYGELAEARIVLTGLHGSSPRVRGTLRLAPQLIGNYRFIPACAGNSFQFSHDGNESAVHPRVYGELHIGIRLDDAKRGSSPRVRGTFFQAQACRRKERFIPACAGNSQRTVTPSGASTVHPRVYGELNSADQPPWFISGSSPRVRGTLGSHIGNILEARFIPACTGNSSPALRRLTGWPVHPRVYGELNNCCIPGVVVSGSSPRVRGTQSVGLLAQPQERFIPACTGNSQSAYAV